MRFLSSLVLLAGISLAAPAMAQDSSAAGAAPAAKPAKPKRICRVDPTLGSVVPRYVCHSKEEWAVIDKASQDASDNAQNGTMGALGNGGSRGAAH